MSKLLANLLLIVTIGISLLGLLTFFMEEITSGVPDSITVHLLCGISTLLIGSFFALIPRKHQISYINKTWLARYSQYLVNNFLTSKLRTSSIAWVILGLILLAIAFHRIYLILISI